MEILARAVGRRKEAVAQIQLVRGNGKFLINDKPAQVYLQNNSCSLICIKSPLEAALSLYSNNGSNIPSSALNDSAFSEAKAISEADNTVNAKLEEQSTSSKLLQTEKSEILNNKESGVEANVANSFVKTQSSPDPFRTSSASKGSSAPMLCIPSFGTQVEELGAEFVEEGKLEGTPNLETQNLNDSTQKLNLISLNNLVSLDEIDVLIKVKGGGLIGQAEAIKLGIARAFCLMQVALTEGIFKKILKTKGYLTQDSRVKERRKYGLKKARKASQYHKR